MAEINVTPMVDVMLVLLIIFMVAAPLMTSNIRHRPADREWRQVDSSNQPPLTLSVKRTGGGCNSKVEIYLGDTPITVADLVPKIKAITDAAVGCRRTSSFCAATRSLLHGHDEGAGATSGPRASSANIVIVPEGGGHDGSREA